MPTNIGDSLAVRRIQWVLLSFTALLPLAVWPGAERPFSTIKLQLLTVVVPVALVAAAGLRLLGRPKLPLGMDIALILSGVSLALSSITGPWVSLPALALAALGLGWFWTLMSFQPEAARLLLALALSGGVVAAVALFQFVDLDPFRALGWTGQEFQASRMRLFSTLGNPNFVAAFLAGVLPAQFSIAVTRWSQHRNQALAAALACGLSMLALALTGSRGAYLGLGLAVVWSVGVPVFSRKGLASLVSRSSVTMTAGLAMAVALSLMAAYGTVARNPRPIGRAIEGRLYIWTIAVGHLREYVGAGLGPGSFAQVFPAWEAVDWQAGRLDEAQREFVSAAQDHAHNEYLELLVEQGIVGLGSLVVLLAVFFTFAGRRAATPATVAASSGVAALAGVALTDFPFHRPAELFLFWTLIAAGFLSGQGAIGRQRNFTAPAGPRLEE